MIKKQVKYRDRLLGELTVHGREDWKNGDREPTERDFRMMVAAMGADLTHEILEREPKKADEAEPDLPWPMVIIREIATTWANGRDEKMEEQILVMYVSRHGMDQILSIWGADIGKLMGEIGNMIGEESSSQ